jgi:adhesin transport system membrane fusion protein
MSTTDFNKLSKEMSGKSGIAGSLLLLLIIALVVILLIWADRTELDNVTRGQGKIISSMQNQLVQASEGGVLKATYIEEGQRVVTGQTLMEIDPIDAKTAYEQARQRLASLKIQEERLSAEILGRDVNFSAELKEIAPSVVTIETALFGSRNADLTAQLSVLEQQLNQRNQQVNEVNVNILTAQDTLALVDEQIAIMEPLVLNGLSPETELLSLRRQAKDFEGRKQASMASLDRIRSSIFEVQQQMASVRQSYSTQSQSELAQIISQIAEINSRLPALEDRVLRTQLKSPVDGIVNRLNFRTLGGFVQPGDVIAELVPIGDELIVEVKIDPKDIAYIQPGQKVRISLTAYDASRYGTIDGLVQKVSADAVLDNNSGVSAYIVETSIDSELVEDDGSQVEVLPGMVASIDVLAGKRTILEYLWQPMAKIKERAFTD